MQFKDIDIWTKFTLDSYPGKIFTKVQEYGGNCCNPPYNAKASSLKIKVDPEKNIEVKNEDN